MSQTDMNPQDTAEQQLGATQDAEALQQTKMVSRKLDNRVPEIASDGVPQPAVDTLQETQVAPRVQAAHLPQVDEKPVVTTMAPSSEGYVERPEDGEGGKKTWLIIGIVLALIILAAAFVLGASRVGKTSLPSGNNNNQSTPAQTEQKRKEANEDVTTEEIDITYLLDSDETTSDGANGGQSGSADGTNATANNGAANGGSGNSANAADGASGEGGDSSSGGSDVSTGEVDITPGDNGESSGGNGGSSSGDNGGSNSGGSGEGNSGDIYSEGGIAENGDIILPEVEIGS